MGRRWKTVLIGVGRMGRNHLRVIQESAQFQLVGVVDPEIDRIATESNGPPPSPDIHRWRTLDECLREGDFEVAVVAVPTRDHYDVARRLVLAGKHLLVEKPVTTRQPEALELAALCEKQGTTLKVAHLERLNPAITKLKEVFGSGIVGDPIHYSFTRVGGYPGSVQPTDNVLVDLAVHDIDVLNFLTGGTPLSVLGVAAHSTWRPPVLDTAEILLQNSASVSASIHVNWITPTKIRSLRVTCTRGICLVDYILQTCVILGGGFLRSPMEPRADFEALTRLYRSSDRVELGVEREEPLKIQLREFDRALRGELTKICSILEAATAVDIAEQSLLQHQSAKIASLKSAA